MQYLLLIYSDEKADANATKVISLSRLVEPAIADLRADRELRQACE